MLIISPSQTQCLQDCQSIHVIRNKIANNCSQANQKWRNLFLDGRPPLRVPTEEAKWIFMKNHKMGASEFEPLKILHLQIQKASVTLSMMALPSLFEAWPNGLQNFQL